MYYYQHHNYYFGYWVLPSVWYRRESGNEWWRKQTCRKTRYFRCVNNVVRKWYNIDIPTHRYGLDIYNNRTQDNKIIILCVMRLCLYIGTYMNIIFILGHRNIVEWHICVQQYLIKMNKGSLLHSCCTWLTYHNPY